MRIKRTQFPIAVGYDGNRAQFLTAGAKLDECLLVIVTARFP